MAVDCELGRAADLRERHVQSALCISGEFEVADRSAGGTDQVMVMVVGESFCELEACVVIVGNNACEGTDFFEDRKVPVHARLCESGVHFQDVQDRYRARRGV